MANQNRALQRLCIAGVGAATLIAGLPFVGVTAASAAHVGSVEFFSPLETDISSNTDGTNSTVKLLVDAPGASAPVPVTRVVFSFSTNGGDTYTEIANVTSRPFTTEWNTLGLAQDTAVLIKAEGFSAAGASVSEDIITRNVDNNAATVNVTSPASVSGSPASVGTFLGSFIARGTFTPGSDPTIVVGDAFGDDEGPGFDSTVEADITGNTWSAIVPTATPASATATPNPVYVNASNGITDETELASTYAQLVQAPQVTPSPVNDTPTTMSTEVTARIVDQSGAVVGNALVELDLDRDGDGEDSGTTDANGLVTFDVGPFDADADGPNTGGTRQVDVIVNQTVTPGFNSLDGDKRTTITQNTVTPIASGITIESIDEIPSETPPGTEDAPFPSFPQGTTNFDVAEETPTIRVALTDQSGQPFPTGTVVNYTVVFNPDEDGPDVPASNTTVTDSGSTTDGFLEIVTDNLGDEGTYTVSAYVNRDNDAAQTPGDLVATPVTFTFDEATLSFDSGVESQIEAGTTTTRAFSYRLDSTTGSGAALAGRLVDLTLGGGDDIPVASGGAIFSLTQPAGTTRLADRSAFAVTNAGGAGSASVTDPATLVDEDMNAATPNVQQQEDIVLTAEARSSGRDASTLLTFRRGVTPAEIRVEDIDGVFDDGDPGETASPGRPVTVTLSVDNVNNGAAGNGVNDLPLSGLPVSLTLDKGYFTSPDDGDTTIGDDGVDSAAELVPASTPTGVAPVGAYRADVTPKVLTTSDGDGGLNTGEVSFTVAIDRDADFDDDGVATVNVTAVVGGVTRVIPVKFLSDDYDVTERSVTVPASNGAPAQTYSGDEPLNAAASNPIEIVSVPANQVLVNRSSNAADAGFQVRARDGFGNLVGVPVSVESDTGSVSDNSVVSSFTGATAATFTADSDLPSRIQTGPEQTQSQTVTASWNALATTYSDADPITAGFQYSPASVASARNLVQDTQAISYFTPIADQFVYTFASTPGNTVSVGTAVNTVVTVKDQRGNPVQGLPVDFIRSGPGEQTGVGPEDLSTNADGQAGFTFTSPTVGRAVVTVIVSDGNNIELSRGVQNVDFIQAAQGTSVSINATPLVRWPGAPVITGVLRNAAGDPLPGRVVNIIYKQQSVSGLAAFRPVLRLTTDANGVYRGSIRPTVNAVWQAIYLGNNAEGASGSAYDVTKVQIANPTVNGFGTTLTVRSTRTVNFSGIVTPGSVRHPVVVQWIRPDGIFNLTAPKRTDAVGNYVTGRTFAPGTYRLRVLGVNTANNIASASRTVTLRVVQ